MGLAAAGGLAAGGLAAGLLAAGPFAAGLLTAGSAGAGLFTAGMSPVGLSRAGLLTAGPCPAVDTVVGTIGPLAAADCVTGASVGSAPGAVMNIPGLGGVDGATGDDGSVGVAGTTSRPVALTIGRGGSNPPYSMGVQVLQAGSTSERSGWRDSLGSASTLLTIDSSCVLTRVIAVSPLTSKQALALLKRSLIGGGSYKSE